MANNKSNVNKKSKPKDKSKMNKKEKSMANYTITAIITKVTSGGKVAISGVGKHRYEKSKDEILNFLEANGNAQNSKLMKPDKEYAFDNTNSVMIFLLAFSMLNKKPLKLKVEGSDDGPYSITEVEVP